MGFNIERVSNNWITLNDGGGITGAVLSGNSIEVNTKTVYGQMDALNKSSIVQACVITHL